MFGLDATGEGDSGVASLGRGDRDRMKNLILSRGGHRGV